jgi:hypothetical protein
MNNNNYQETHRKHNLIDHLKWPFKYFCGSMEQNLSGVDLIKSNVPLDYDCSIIFAGDFMGLGHKIPHISKPLQHFINSGNLFVGNLECAISNSKLPNLLFQSSSDEVIKSLKSQINQTNILFSLANNHSGDYNLKRSKKILNQNSIQYFGTTDKPCFKFNNINILAGTFWLPKKNSNLINNLESSLKLMMTHSDETFVTYFHYGDEFKLTSNLPIQLPPNTILHLGHHPHVPHIPKLGEIPLFTSLGNFWISYGGPKVQHGIILKAYFKSHKLVGYEWRFLKSTSSSKKVEIDFCQDVDYFL